MTLSNQQFVPKDLVASVIVIILLSACSIRPAAEPPVSTERGQVIKAEDVYGTFFAYIPTTANEQSEILLLIHGTPVKAEDINWNAEYYITNWMDFADQHNFILLAPVFNQEDFSSSLGDHAMSGYRGLFGREIAADEWVLRLVKAYQGAYALADEQFYLYGHSAGGQYVARFLVTHPEIIKKAVITSAATYPQPTTEVTWPYGMGALKTDILWDSENSNRVNIKPDKQKWLQAVQIPLTVIVGLNDKAELPAELLPGQKGNNRLVIAKNWVTDMNDFAESHGVESHFTLEIIPGQGHTLSGLLPFSQQALAPD